MRGTIRTTVLMATLAATPAMVVAQQPDPEVMAEGGRLYSETCARCHNPRPATERGDREWTTILMHMRARANLTKSDTEAIRVFLQATNRDGRQTSARDATRREATAGAPARIERRLADVDRLLAGPAGAEPAVREAAVYLDRLRENSRRR